jgi:hypothetical protein
MTTSAGRFRSALVGLLVLLATTAGALAPASASAAPALRLTSLIPDHVTPAQDMLILLSVQNVGSDPLQGELSVDYEFPPGVEPAEPDNFFGNVPDPVCQTSGQLVSCQIDVSAVQSGTEIRFRTLATVQPSATGVLSGQIRVSGGGTPGMLTEPLSLDTSPIGPFALRSFDLEAAAGAYPVIQAASDPAQFSAGFSLISAARANLNLPGLTITAPPESLRDVVIHLPPGFVGLPGATPLRCSAAQLNTVIEGTDIPACPPSSQVGLVQVNGGDLVPLYNVEPPVGHPAEFGFSYLDIVVVMAPRLRPADDGIDVLVDHTISSAPIDKAQVILWGIPADPSHDHLRTTCLQGLAGYNPDHSLACPFVGERTPFLRTPTSCSGEPLRWGIELDSYQHPGAFISRDAGTRAQQGCQNLPFDPSLSVAATEPSPHTPSGLDVALTMPQQSAPDGLAEADLRTLSLTLPAGVTINPAAADGLRACTDSELRLDLAGPSECPPASRIAIVCVHTPLLDHPLRGWLVVRSQASRDPASGDLYRVAIELRSDRDGLAIRIPGSVRADPASGRLTASFDDLAQLPFDSVHLNLDAGPRAPLSMPNTCGTQTTHAELTSWARPDQVVSLQPSFEIDQDCQAPRFTPGFEAGVANPRAGAYSPFILRVTRGPGQPNLARISVTLPPGELARFAGVPLCPESSLASGDCPPESQIGSAVAALGEGPSPLFLPQPGRRSIAIYIAGPYHGAPYSILTSVPAQAGPFDLGTVSVRSAIRIDPHDARASVVSDPLPQIYGGIPVAYRDVRVAIDRPHFALNPTSCEHSSVAAVIESAAAQSAALSSRFQASDCAALGFSPRLSLALQGQLHRRAHPALTATLRAKPGDANIARAQLTLPPAALLDQSQIGTVCTRVQFAARACPAASIYGRASARTPLLDYPLTGNVYLRSSNHPLPDLLVDLRGPSQTPIEITLLGRTDSVGGALRATFTDLPDAPLSIFHLRLFGGRRGLIELSSGLCSEPRANGRLDAQNGRSLESRPRLTSTCARG